MVGTQYQAEHRATVTHTMQFCLDFLKKIQFFLCILFVTGQFFPCIGPGMELGSSALVAGLFPH